MARHTTEEAPVVPAGASITRTLLMQLDEEGVLRLDSAFLAALHEGDALGVPGPCPTCESCWTEAAIAIALLPGNAATFMGAACASSARQAGARLVLLVSS